MKNLTDQQLKNELQERGYHTRTLWNVEDVKNRFECSDKQALSVLDYVFSSEYIMDEIDRCIEEAAEDEFNLKEKES